MINKKIAKSFTFQQDQSDCGVACLLSILKFHGSNSSLEHLRELSGTNTMGTTLLGLHNATNNLGFEAKGMKGDIINIAKTSNPIILHVLKNKKFEHYIVFYGGKKQ